MQSYEASSGKHRVAYDDGDVEELLLSQEKFEVVQMSSWQRRQAEAKREAALERRREKSEEAAATKRAKVVEEARTPAPRKRRVVVEDEDERPAKRESRKESFDASAFRSRFKMTPAQQSRGGEVPVVSSTSSRESEEPLAVSEGGEPRSKGGVLPAGSHSHDVDDRYAFLTRDRQDARGKRPDEVGFDPKTLKIPGKFLRETTSEVQKQWWQLKATHADCVLFFKIGRFYELYHVDADVGVKEAGLVYMKGEQAHAGFPEPAYGKYAEVLLSKGYKVARVEQTETPEGNKARVERAKERGRSVDKAFKAMRREVCSLTTPGTRLYTYLDEDSDQAVGPNDGPLCAVVCDGDGRYGCCLLDAPTGSFTLAEFDDDAQRSRLRTLLSERRPVELLLPVDLEDVARAAHRELRDLVDRAAKRVRPGQAVVVEALYDPWDLNATLAELSPVFPKASKTAESVDVARWPVVVRRAVERRAVLAIKALGAVVWWLRRGLIDVELLTMGNFDCYAPADLSKADDDDAPPASSRLGLDEAELARGESAVRREEMRQGGDDDDVLDDQATEAPGGRMTLDATTLKNLEILQAIDGRASGSLWELVNQARTPTGSRKLKGWLARPLYEATDIEARADAVAFLVDKADEADEARAKLGKIPDLERLLQQLHTLGSARRAPTPPGEEDDMARHPDSRAVLFDAVKLDAKKVQQLCKALEGLRRCEAFVEHARHHLLCPDNTPGLLARCFSAFPDVGRHLDQFESGFDLDRARLDGTLEAKPGADDAYDAAKDDEAAVVKRLDDWLRAKKKELRCDASYSTTARDRYALKLPEEVVARSSFVIPRGWKQKSKSRKSVSFAVPQVIELVDLLEAAEKRVRAAKVDQLRSIFAAFDQRRRRWSLAVDCVSTLDALLALARVSRRQGFCRPRIVRADRPVLEISNGAHPCLEATLGGGGQVVGNDLVLGGRRDAAVLLLTGPNMGGKSTLLRHVCVSTILAQTGCYVRADAFRFSPVDRIFTRLGASDKILDNQSTFMVELLETATVLKQATPNSLCILDELGRGTATFDGCAIAHCVVDHLVANIPGCRALFATHYHMLVADYAQHPAVQLGHMDCIVDDDHDSKVTFLYKLVPGLSPKSFGINVARLAHLPQAVIDMALAKSREFEARLHGGGSHP